ncbi:MAG: 50S ribosomal protein L11 methyltransferase [Sphingobacteriaceae bacterium]|nr:50S ribosomal protein L11 methyltransferase [Sphingobacteriaceae bacterium]
MSYFAFQFVVEPVDPGSDILIAVLAEAGFESFENNENGFVGYIPEELAESLQLSEIAFDDFKFTYSKSKIEKENWNEVWEKNFNPVLIENELLIRAPFHAVNNAVKREIIIMPKMSFGTGHHQTTKLVCAEMLGMDFKDKSVLDMGCGTGILAILARQLGAQSILGIDIDDWSVENAIENCKVNACEEIKIIKGDDQSIPTNQMFDVILANINKNILKRQIKTYQPCLKANGFLLISGFFKTDIPELIQAAEQQKFKFHKQETDGEWAMLVFKKN